MKTKQIVSKWYKSWKNARQRCLNPKATSYRIYGGLGIQCLLLPSEVQKLWIRDKGYLMNHPSLDRIDIYGDYVYENCRFIEHQENRRRSKRKLSTPLDKSRDRLYTNTER